MTTLFDPKHEAEIFTMVSRAIGLSELCKLVLCPVSQPKSVQFTIPHSAGVEEFVSLNDAVQWLRGYREAMCRKDR
jgi:hypothetical protein